MSAAEAGRSAITGAPSKSVPESDGDLLMAVASGNLASLGTLFDRHEQAVRRFVVRLGIDVADADDVIHTVFIQSIRAARRFDGRPSARPWLLGIASRVVRRERRSLARMARRLAAWAAEPREVADHGPEQSLDAAQRVELARRALARLSSKKREVFVMVVLEGVRGEDAAVALGIPVGTVWTRLHSARQELRRWLLKEST